ncbi:MAG: FAD:protein FMN transferase [Prevotella sp.]
MKEAYLNNTDTASGKKDADNSCDAIKRKRVKRTLQIIFLLFLIIGSVIIIHKEHNKKYISNTGFVFGTVYNITYQSDKDLQKEIEDELQKVDNSLSTFNTSSVISRINNNQDYRTDGIFNDVFNLAQTISHETDGAFDITVAPLVNVWGFGFKHDKLPDNSVIDSLMQIIGYDKVKLSGNRIVKKDKRIMLDCSAIAKGYGSDAVARLLRSKGIENFMVEIGGEIVVNGVNSHNSAWRIGVTRPVDDSLNTDNEMQTIVNVTDMAMATSGNYRNFYYKNGKKYAHTISPATGYPVQHNILSATVFAADCATADAYATAFMVSGLDKAKEILKRHPELMAYFILASDDGKNDVWYSPSLKSKISQ